MKAAEHGWIARAFYVLAAIGIVYMMLPLLMVFPLSVEPGHILRYPPQGLTLHWYAQVFADGRWLEPAWLSIRVAAAAAAVATVVGTMAALGLARASGAAGGLCYAILMSPLFLPTIVISVAIYGVYVTLQLVGSPLGLIAAHAVLTIPFVVLNVATSLAAAPRPLQEAAMSLGAGPVATFFQITLPLISKGVGAGAIFAFLVSFDEVVVAMFLSGSRAVTLPVRMLEGVFYELSPMLAAVSVLLVIPNVLLGAAGFALVRRQ